MPKQLDLFPDLVDQNDPMKLNANWERRGHAVWCIDDLPSKSINENMSEQVALAIIFDDERFSVSSDRTGKHWIVEIKHHLYEWVTIETGWGSSRKAERKLDYRSRIVERHFSTRTAACEFAERVVAVFNRMKLKWQNS